ncbi:MAG: FAD-binding protein, partial [Patescibacteria group bacterium]
MRVEENVPLARVTTFRIGGPARYILTIANAHEVEAAVTFARERTLPVIPLGDGSNILAPDKGVEAVFVRLTANAIRPTDFIKGMVTVTVDAGSSWDAFVEHAVREGWWGIENLSGIPGTVGAAVVQNIGAYGTEIADTVISVRAL